MRAIIPAAGFGTRLKMKPNQSKEMLTDNIYGYEHIIDFAIHFCKINDIEPFVITREDKKDLIKYLKKNKIKYMLYEPKKDEEWYDTVIASKEHWVEENLLLLPDTRFRSLFLGEQIENSLKLGNNAVLVLHKVDNPSKWGIINKYQLLEKPTNLKCSQWAWGLIGFKKEYGEYLFTKYYTENGYRLKDCGFMFLNSFKDITRGKDV